MVAIGEKTGNLDRMLEKSAATFDEEASDSLEKLSNDRAGSHHRTLSNHNDYPAR